MRESKTRKLGQRSYRKKSGTRIVRVEPGGGKGVRAKVRLPSGTRIAFLSSTLRTLTQKRRNNISSFPFFLNNLNLNFNPFFAFVVAVNDSFGAFHLRPPLYLAHNTKLFIIIIISPIKKIGGVMNLIPLSFDYL